MNPALACAALLAFGVVAGGARLVWQSWRAAPAGRPQPWRTALLVLGPAIAAGLLYCTMWPPARVTAPGTLTVVTVGATAQQIRGIAAGQHAIALPGATAPPGIERVPDLATALRRNPSVTQLDVVGAGLPPRDLDAARALSVSFEPAALPRGLVELWYPRRVAIGARWHLAGRLQELAGSSVELLDPARQRIARAATDDDGRFELQAESRAPGSALFFVRVLDRAQRPVEEVAVPVHAVADTPARVLVLAGAPNPEVKYLRRWALDAGVELRSEVLIRPGMRVQRSPVALTADALRDVDLVITDERAWRAAGAAGQAQLRTAVAEGMGLLIRVTGTLSAAELEEVRSLGFDVQTRELARTIQLAQVGTEMTRRPLSVTARDGVPLLRSATGEPLALWRPEGRGRVAIWWLNDSYRMALDGSSVAHGTLWSDTVSTLGRARGKPEPSLGDTESRVEQRQVICAVETDASVMSPAGRRVPLLRDASTGCAAYWPADAGWHVLLDSGNEWPFYVRATGEAAGLALHDMRVATLAIAGARSAPTHRMEPAQRSPGAPWPYLLACLAVLASTWWLERSTLGRGGTGRGA